MTTTWEIRGLSAGAVPGFVLATLRSLDTYPKEMPNGITIESAHLPISVPLEAGARYCIGDRITLTSTPHGVDPSS